MVGFIRQEAEERARELAVEAEEEYNVAKLGAVEAGRRRLRLDYERRAAGLAGQARVDASRRLGETRLRVLGAKQAVLDHVVAEARRELARTAADPGRYVPLLTALVAQGVARLWTPPEDSAASSSSQQQAPFVVRVREADRALAEGCLGPARAAAAQRLGVDVGLVPPARLDDASRSLPPAPDAAAASASREGDDHAERASCLGGCVVLSPDGRIRSTNTLDDRLRVAVEEGLPGLQAALFPSLEDLLGGVDLDAGGLGAPTRAAPTAAPVGGAAGDLI